MKPIFIYKYEKNMQKKSKEFFNLFMQQGNEIEQEYAHENFSMRQMREEGLKMVQFEPETEGLRSAMGTDYGKSAEKSHSQAGFSYISRQFTKTRRRIQAKKGFGKTEHPHGVEVKIGQDGAIAVDADDEKDGRKGRQKKRRAEKKKSLILEQLGDDENEDSAPETKPQKK